MVGILGMATARPPFRLSQKEALRFILKNFKMRPGTRALYEKVLSDRSIQKRRFALKNLKEVLEEDPDKINLRFEKESVALSTGTLKQAMKKSGVAPRSLDFLAVSTCTGYLCPGISSRLIETCGLRRDIRCLDVVGMGCGSAIPALEAAHNFIKANPKSLAAVVSTEICSAAIFSDDAPDLIVSNAIFADGSAALVISDSASRGLADTRKFSSVTHPEWRESLRFKTQGGRLRNVLGKDVPSQAARSLKPLIEKTLREAGQAFSQVDHWIFHSGGKKVLDAVQEALHLSDEKMKLSRKILKDYGNMSSPTVLYGLDEVLSGSYARKSGDTLLLSSFGAGISAYACLLELH